MRCIFLWQTSLTSASFQNNTIVRCIFSLFSLKAARRRSMTTSLNASSLPRAAFNVPPIDHLRRLNTAGSPLSQIILLTSNAKSSSHDTGTERQMSQRGLATAFQKCRGKFSAVRQSTRVRKSRLWLADADADAHADGGDKRRLGRAGSM